MQVTEQRAAATAVLRIHENDRGRDVLSVNTSGKVLEYQLRQTIRFSVATAENLPVVEQQTVTLSRAYLYSSTDVLGSEREKEAVRSTLQKNLVNMAMLRIAAAARVDRRPSAMQLTPEQLDAHLASSWHRSTLSVAMNRCVSWRRPMRCVRRRAGRVMTNARC